MSSLKSGSYKWLGTGDQCFPAMLAAMQAAQKTIRFETYIYSGDELGRRFLAAFVAAQQRGVRVQVLVDGFGSQALSSSFWQPLLAGGEARWFNPVLRQRLGFRDHRKILVCDEAIAFVGGFNVSEEYRGDGVKSGWCDLGLQVTSPLAADLAAAFDEMFARADFQHKPFTRLRRSLGRKEVRADDGQLLLSGPGRGRNPFKASVHHDLRHARNVQIIMAYFLPTRRIRRDLMRLAREGHRVQLILPGKSDVRLSQLAARSLYRRFLNAGVQIYEYQPQILHAKLILLDKTVYVGSSNLDPRSLHLNYEVMLRFHQRELAAEAESVFQEKLAHCNKIEAEAWRKSRGWLAKLRGRWAYFLLVHVDPFVARWSQQKRT